MSRVIRAAGQPKWRVFASEEPHRTIVKRSGPWAKTATFRFWTAPADQVTPARLWAEAESRISVSEN